MGLIRTLGDHAFREFELVYVPASGNHDVVKSEVRDTFAQIDAQVTALEVSQTGGTLGFQTRAALYAAAAQPVNTQAQVWADSTAAYNGVYVNTTGGSGAGAWTKVADHGLVTVTSRVNALEDDVADINDALAIKQPLNANLTALAGLNGGGFAAPVIGRIPYLNGPGTMTSTTLTEPGRLMMNAGDAAAQVTLLGAGNAGRAVFHAAGFGDIRNLLTLNYATGPEADDPNEFFRVMSPGRVHQVVQAAIEALIGAAPGALDTWAELVAAIQSNQSAASALTTAINGKQAKHANLDALSSLTLAPDRGLYSTAAGVLATFALTGEGRAFLAAATKAEQRASLGITAAGEALALAVDAEAQRAALSLVPGVDVVEHVGFPKALAEHSFGAGELVRATGPDSVAGLPLSTLMAPILALTTQEGVLGALGFTTDAKSLRGSTFAQMRDFLSLQYADATQAAAGLSSAMVMSPIRTKEVVTAAVGALSASTNASLALKANRSVQITVSGGVLSGGGGLDGNVNINLDAAALNARIDQRLNTSSAMVAAAQAFGSFINDNPEAAAALATIGLIDTGPVTLARFGGGPGASDAELQAALQTAWELRRPVLWDRPGTILLRTQEYMDEAVSPADARNRWAEILDWQGTCRGRVGVERPSGFRRLNGDSFIRGVHQNPLIERSYDSEGVSEIVMTSATLTATSTAGRYLVRVALASDINAVQPDLQEGVGVSIQNPKPRANDEADRLANRFVAALAGPIIIDAWDEIGGLWVEGFVWMNTLVPAGVTIPIGVPMYFDSTGADDTVNRSRLVVYPCGWLFEGGWSGTAEEGAYRLEDAVLNRRDIMDSWVGSMADGCQIFATGSLSRIELEDNCGLAAGPEKVVRPVNGAHLRGYNLIAGGAGCLTTKETLYGQSGPRFDLVRSDIGASRNVAINLTDDSEMTATLGRVCGGGQEAISANRGTQVELGSMEIGYSARGLYAGNDSRISVDPDCVIEGNYQAMDADARGLIVAANGAPLQRDNAFERIPNIAVDGGLYTVGVDAVGHQPGEDARLGTRGGTVRFPLAGGAGIVFVVSDTDKDASIALTVDLVNPPADPARVLWRGQLARKGVGVLRRQSHPGYISASVAFENGLPYLYVVNDRNATFLVNVVTFGNLVAGPGETVQPSGATANIRAAGAAPYPGFTRAAGVGTIAVETTLDAGGVPVPHTFVVGQTVVVAGLDASVNGNQVVTAVLLPDRFQFANAGPDTTLGGGTVAHPTPPTITAQDRPSLDEEVLALAAGDLGLPVIQYTHPESMSADVAGGIVVTVGRSYFFPVFLNRAVDRIGVDVVANGAGAVRFGLRLNDNGKIGPLILDLGTAALTGTGVKTRTIAQDRKGLFWLEAVFSNAVTVRTGPARPCALLGASGWNTAPPKALYKEGTYAAGLAAGAPVPAGYVATDAPLVMLWKNI